MSSEILFTVKFALISVIEFVKLVCAVASKESVNSIAVSEARLLDDCVKLIFIEATFRIQLARKILVILEHKFGDLLHRHANRSRTR